GGVLRGRAALEWSRSHVLGPGAGIGVGGGRARSVGRYARGGRRAGRGRAGRRGVPSVDVPHADLPHAENHMRTIPRRNNLCYKPFLAGTIAEAPISLLDEFPRTARSYPRGPAHRQGNGKERTWDRSPAGFSPTNASSSSSGCSSRWSASRPQVRRPKP